MGRGEPDLMMAVEMTSSEEIGLRGESFGMPRVFVDPFSRVLVDDS